MANKNSHQAGTTHHRHRHHTVVARCHSICSSAAAVPHLPTCRDCGGDWHLHCQAHNRCTVANRMQMACRLPNKQGLRCVEHQKPQLSLIVLATLNCSSMAWSTLKKGTRVVWESGCGHLDQGGQVPWVLWGWRRGLKKKAWQKYPLSGLLQGAAVLHKAICLEVTKRKTIPPTLNI